MSRISLRSAFNEKGTLFKVLKTDKNFSTKKSRPLIQTLKFFIFFRFFKIFFKVAMEMNHLLTSSVARFNKDNILAFYFY